MNRGHAFTSCCIAGGGPAGMMLGFLLARAGVDVTVLEKHGDFLRDFRGDTIHPSTIELMAELGLAEKLLALRHEKARELVADVGGTRLRVCDFSALDSPYPYIAFMPQWDFLDFIADEARRFANFRLEMDAEAIDVLRDGAGAAGVVYRKGGKETRLSAVLTVACDGRGSTLRARMGDSPRSFGAPMDVMWFRLPREVGDPEGTGARLDRGRMMVTIDRGDYWQAAYLVPKGGDADVRARGIAEFRANVRAMLPMIPARRMDAIRSLEDVKTLEVKLDRLECWHRPGLLYIGDAAHAMSPIGGVGINLAIQDAVAAANCLARPLRAGRVSGPDLARVQARRRWPTAATQLMQRVAQRRVIGAALSGAHTPRPPAWLPWLLARGPVKRGAARLIGRGVRPEHIDTEALSPAEAGR